MQFNLYLFSLWSFLSSVTSALKSEKGERWYKLMIRYDLQQIQKRVLQPIGKYYCILRAHSKLLIQLVAVRLTSYRACSPEAHKAFETCVLPVPLLQAQNRFKKALAFLFSKERCSLVESFFRHGSTAPFLDTASRGHNYSHTKQVKIDKPQTNTTFIFFNSTTLS